MNRRCLGCGALLRSGSRCAACRLPREPRALRGRPWMRLRARILERDRHTCQTCGQPATHVDHVVALARGGSDDPSNLRALCQLCNLRKGDR